MRFLVHMVLGAFILLMAGCDSTEAPGDLVGEYIVSGPLSSNTCGAEAVDAATALCFNVDLRLDGDVPYWYRSGSSPITGEMESPSRFVFEVTKVVRLAANVSMPEQRCSLCQVESIVVSSPEPLNITSSAGDSSQPSNLSVVTTIEWQPLLGSVCDTDPDAGATADSACDYILELYSRPFDTIPCEVEYLALEQVFCPCGLTDCAGSCRDLETDAENCGGCGETCSAGEVCSAGSCGAPQ